MTDAHASGGVVEESGNSTVTPANPMDKPTDRMEGRRDTSLRDAALRRSQNGNEADVVIDEDEKVE